MKAIVCEILLKLVLYMVRIWFIRQEMQVGFERAKSESVFYIIKMQ